MQIDYDLLERIEALNARGISCFRIAKIAKIQPTTLRRFVFEETKHMEEETFHKLLHAVNYIEDGFVHVSTRMPFRKRDPMGEVIIMVISLLLPVFFILGLVIGSAISF